MIKTVTKKMLVIITMPMLTVIGGTALYDHGWFWFLVWCTGCAITWNRLDDWARR